MNKFIFPLSKQLQSIQTISSKHHLKQYLDRFKQAISPFHQTSYSIKINRHQQKIIARCLYCKCSLIYQKKEEQWNLIFKRNQHNHSNRKRDSNFDRVEEYCRRMPSYYSKSALRQIVSAKFRIPRAAFNAVYSKIKQNSYIGFEQFYRTYRAHYQIIHTDLGEKEFPDITILSNRKMKDLFIEFGDSICFDLTFSIFKQKSHEDKQFKVGFFIGSNHKNKTIIFAIAVTSQGDKEAIKYIFRKFFSFMGKQPETIITDQDSAIQCALSELKQEQFIKSEHYFDLFHYLKALKCDKKLSGALSNLLRSKSQQEYEFNKTNITKKYKSQAQIGRILNKIEIDKNKICFFMASKFIGLGLSDSKSESFHNKLKKFISRRQSFITGLVKCIDISDKLNLIDCENNWEKPIFQLQHYIGVDLNYVSGHVCRRVFQIFHEEYTKAIQCDYMRSTAQTYQIREIEVNNERIHYSIIQRDEILECNCGFKLLTGIPCRHMCKVSCKTGLNILKQFYSRWLIDPADKNQSLNKIVCRTGSQVLHPLK